MNAADILNQENKCIQEEPVYCSAVCPVHVDVRSMMEQIRSGNFSEAEKLYRSRVLFPGIVSRLCAQPCKNACVRGQIDDPVSIRLLERACADYGGFGKRAYSVVWKQQKVAVVGGGLCGLSCALETVRKGYKVTIFEQSGRLGGKLWDIDPAVLPAEVIAAEMAQLNQEGITIALNTRVEDVSRLDFDAVFIATGEGGSSFGLETENGIPYDPVSLSSAREGVFVGGNLLDEAWSAIELVANGVRAARSIERQLKGASLTGGREGEGVQSTRMVTELRDVPAARFVPPGDENGGYTEAEAMREAGRCLLCDCMECVKGCDFLDFFHQYPKRYIRDIVKTVTAQQGLRSKMIATRIINSCSLCGLCAQICPNGLDMGEICGQSRFLQVGADTMPPAFYDFSLRELQHSNSERARLIKNQKGTVGSSYLFFPGCRMGSSDPDYVIKTYGYLVSRLSGGVGLAVSCCGAPAEWSGRADLMDGQMRALLAEWEAMGKPAIITACPTCAKMLGRHLPNAPLTSLWDVFDEYGFPAEFERGDKRTLALYDPCASRYDPVLQQRVRSLLGKMNYEVEELRFGRQYAQCCSYGGLIATINPELAQKIVDHRVSASEHDYVTYCTNCRDSFAENGKTVWHLLDLLFGQDVGRRPPTHSERRDNRRLLKQRLLDVYWGEDMAIEREPYETLKLTVPDDLLKKMNREYILLDEVRQVVHHAESTGYKLIDSGSGHFIAHLQIGIITVWVEYRMDQDGCTVCNAYSHRMQIVEGGQ